MVTNKKSDLNTELTVAFPRCPRLQNTSTHVQKYADDDNVMKENKTLDTVAISVSRTTASARQPTLQPNISDDRIGLPTSSLDATLVSNDIYNVADFALCDKSDVTKDVLTPNDYNEFTEIVKYVEKSTTEEAPVRSIRLSKNFESPSTAVVSSSATLKSVQQKKSFASVDTQGINDSSIIELPKDDVYRTFKNSNFNPDEINLRVTSTPRVIQPLPQSSLKPRITITSDAATQRVNLLTPNPYDGTIDGSNGKEKSVPSNSETNSIKKRKETNQRKITTEEEFSSFTDTENCDQVHASDGSSRWKRAKTKQSYDSDADKTMQVVPVSAVRKIFQSELRKGINELKQFYAENHGVNPETEAGTTADDADQIPNDVDENGNVTWRGITLNQNAMAIAYSKKFKKNRLQEVIKAVWQKEMLKRMMLRIKSSHIHNPIEITDNDIDTVHDICKQMEREKPTVKNKNSYDKRFIRQIMSGVCKSMRSDASEKRIKYREESNKSRCRKKKNHRSEDENEQDEEGKEQREVPVRINNANTVERQLKKLLKYWPSESSGNESDIGPTIEQLAERTNITTECMKKILTHECSVEIVVDEQGTTVYRMIRFEMECKSLIDLWTQMTERYMSFHYIEKREVIDLSREIKMDGTIFEYLWRKYTIEREGAHSVEGKLYRFVLDKMVRIIVCQILREITENDSEEEKCIDVPKVIQLCQQNGFCGIPQIQLCQQNGFCVYLNVQEWTNIIDVHRLNEREKEAIRREEMPFASRNDTVRELQKDNDLLEDSHTNTDPYHIPRLNRTNFN